MISIDFRILTPRSRRRRAPRVQEKIKTASTPLRIHPRQPRHWSRNDQDGPNISKNHPGTLQKTPLSLSGRGANHVEMPVDWGRGMKRATLHLHGHTTCSRRMTALAEEARLAAAPMHNDEEHARGGPWSLPRIMPRHRQEILMVLGCSSASEVIRLAVPGTALWKHLHDEPYRVGGAGGGGWATRKQF